MARTYAIVSLFLVVTFCCSFIAFAQKRNDFVKSKSFCSSFLFPLVWAQMKNIQGCVLQNKLYDPIRELQKEIGKAEDDTVIPPFTPAKESGDFGNVVPFVAKVLSGHSGPLCPQCPYIPPCPVCPIPICPAIPSCLVPVITSFTKGRTTPRNLNLKGKLVVKRVIRPSPDGFIFITNTNGCTTRANSMDVNLAPCTRGSGAPKGTIEITFTAPRTSVIIGIAALFPDTSINLTCTSFPSNFFGVSQFLNISSASPSVTGVGYLQFLASAGRDITDKFLKCIWFSS